MPFSCSLIDSALTRPILEGTVAASGLDLTFTTATVDENSRAMIAGKYDVAEMSMATYVQARAGGLELLALPVFMGRRFLQPCVAFAPNSTIGSPSDLRGKRIGLPQFWMTSSMWHRGLLEHEYGVPATQVDWVTTQPERLDAGFSPGTRVTNVGDHPLAQLPQLLADGTVDAIFSPRPPARNGTLRFLFDDPAATAVEYRNRTGIYPLLHTVVVKAAHKAHAAALFDLFRRSKEHAYAHPGANEIESPIAGLSFDEARARLGEVYPYGVRANAAAIDAFLDYSVEQGLTGERLKTPDAFIAVE
ncbi:MAG TPA: PhnD/SsuA/transferrin family substrate-binding protein [Candidatus Lustribacter sp.]